MAQKCLSLQEFCDDILCIKYSKIIKCLLTVAFQIDLVLHEYITENQKKNKILPTCFFSWTVVVIWVVIISRKNIKLAFHLKYFKVMNRMWLNCVQICWDL